MKKITIGNDVIKLTGWIEKGVYCIAHFLNGNGSFMTDDEFNRIYNTNVNFLLHNRWKMSVKKYIEETELNMPNGCVHDIPTALKIIYSVPKGVRQYYDILTTDDALPNSRSKWLEKLGTNIPWKRVFVKIHKIQEIKIKWFRMRIVHRILGTNVVLKEMRLVNNFCCDFCLESKGSIDHIFWKCLHVKRFWEEMEELLRSKCVTCANVRFIENVILFSVDENMRIDSIFDSEILLGKMYIYKSKLDFFFTKRHFFYKISYHKIPDRRI